MNKEQFKKISHCGGKLTITIKVDQCGNRSYQQGWNSSNPVPASLCALYSLPQGIPVCFTAIKGMGISFDPPPIPGCILLFLYSDSHGMYGQECPKCNRYWRTHSHSVKQCPYCAFKDPKQMFFTKAQGQFIKKYLEELDKASEVPANGETYEHVIDLDELANQAEENFEGIYYTEESQQNKFKCSNCSEINDIIGKFGYCSSCGLRNDLDEFKKRLQTIRENINDKHKYEDSLQDLVSEVDSLIGRYAKQIVNRIPMIKKREGYFNERKRFHDIAQARNKIFEALGVDIYTNIDEQNQNFCRVKFLRRHVYEHLSGEADVKYISESGDNVRLKQTLNETQEDVNKLADLCLKIITNFHDGFHEIFPPLDKNTTGLFK